MLRLQPDPSPASPGQTWPSRLFVACLLLLACGLLIHPLGDPDVFIHLRDGRYLAEHHLQVTTEPFAYTVVNKPFERAEWLFRISLYWAWKIGGYPLLILLKALAMTAALWLLGRLVYLRWPNLGLVGLLLGLAVLAPMTRIFPERPYVFTYLFLPLALLLLENYRRTQSARGVAWIPLLVVPWANLHPGFMALFGFLGAQILHDGLAFWRTQDPLAWRRARTLAWIALAAFLAGALNPMGFALYSFSLKIMGSREFMQYLLEWAPPRFAHEPVFFLLLAAAWLLQALNWKRLKLYDFLPLLAFSYLALKSYRNIPLFLIAALPPMAGHLAALRERYFPRFGRRLAAWRKACLLAGSLAALLLLSALTASGYAFRLGEIPGFYPRGGLAWLERTGFKGRLLTHDIWGGYTGWMTHGRIKIFMDGRLPTFGEALYADYRKIIWGDPACLPLLDQYRIEGLLVSPKNEMKFFQRLWSSGQWALVYWDDVCLLYLRRQGVNAALAERFAYFAVDPKKSPYYNPSRPRQALQEVIRARAASPDSFLPYFFEGDLHLRLGEPDAARAALEQVLQRAPGHLASLLDLGLIDLEQNRGADAERRFRQVVRRRADAETYGWGAYYLGLVLSRDPARRREALRWTRAAARALPDFPAARELLEKLLAP